MEAVLHHQLAAAAAAFSRQRSGVSISLSTQYSLHTTHCCRRTTTDGAENTDSTVCSRMESPTILNSTLNTTDAETVGSHISHAVLIVAYSSVIVVSVAGNGIVILSVITCRRMRTVTNYFIVSLAGADLMMAVLCVPFTFIANWLVDRWPFGAVMCPIVPYLQTVAVFLSAFTLVGLMAEMVYSLSWLGVRSDAGWPRGQHSLVGLWLDLN